ncbi:aminocarboxymuconate-semialdehyde decarboxylase [Thermocatellispora tengchongensis]|uniref:Aminocarboxymuconate-semialdehyde decarboxylase n=1 Tax=Thermocatellispora tengchongensis TaxID=1073253 RepID=A0A840PAJ6_9ACTN|nr:amidohydrolase family protein [Thermocatellispora tengchongensis]MBB5134953.1 aminocarboxymuconate-semialdehyde decarboxylase [Thermocatellispora tengchongensis]
MDRPPALDAHAHVWLDAVEDLAARHPGYAAGLELEARRAGAESAAVNAEQAILRRALLTDVDARLAAMDSAGVTAQLVSVVPTQYHGWADRGLAAEIAAATNAGVAAHCALRPDRLAGLGVVPLRHPDLAVTALEDAVLRHGLKGVEISSHAAGPDGVPVELSDRRLDPLWQRAVELGAVLLLHPWGCTLDARLDRWYLANTVGQPVEHAVALSHLIFGGVLDRFPELRLIAAHGGGYLPAFLGRADHAWQHRPDARSCAEPPSAYVRRLWFDSLVHTPQALRRLVETVGAERVVLGSDYPFDMGVTDPVARALAALGPADAAAVIGGNAARLGLFPGVLAPRT